MKTRGILVAAVALALLAGCRERRYFFHGGDVFGTTYRVKYEARAPFREEIQAVLARVDTSLSLFNERSLLSRLNRDEDVPVDDLFTRVFEMATRVHERTAGAFDITIAPLVNAWGFGPEGGRELTPARVDSLLSFVGTRRLALRDGRLVKEKKGIRVDAGAIAKGLGVDEVARLLEGKGVENYLVEIGGEVRVKGQSDTRAAWWIGVLDPLEEAREGQQATRLVIATREGALATSGNYRNFREREGQRYGHTIDPRTGYPVQRDVLSASVFAASCMEADAYATAFMVMGLEESCRLVEDDPALEACLIFRDGEGNARTWLSRGFREMVIRE
ncbi:MAG: FAD:protein FMN transferase [Odoribacteraceae bacterium]|jgi:thiamine biosynthesis lipoprotein|nr:FAD:protein FMN transferase [Odoribacteraceae bacterium]